MLGAFFSAVFLALMITTASIYLLLIYWTLLLLALPYLGLCFPSLYARATPALFGFPFFYWYQFAAVIATALLTGAGYWLTRDRADE